MTDFIYGLQRAVSAAAGWEYAWIVFVAATAVIPAALLIWKIVYLFTGDPVFRLERLTRKYIASNGRITTTNANAYSRRVLRKAGCGLQGRWKAAFAAGGLNEAGRELARAVSRPENESGVILQVAATWSAITAAACIYAGESAGFAVTAAALSLVPFIVAAVVYAVFKAVVRALSAGKRVRAAQYISTGIFESCPLPAALIPESADKYVLPRAEVDKLIEQVEEMLHTGVSAQVAGVLARGLDYMLASGVYDSGERLRLTNLHERVKKICA